MSATDKEAVFTPVPTALDFPKSEAEILAFWKKNRIFEKTLTADTRATGASKGTYVFYEGPPTANGMPHNGHVLTRAVKDVFPRYKTMQGYDVPRKAGWDTHGLPVEVEVEKELRIHGKADIEKYGVEPFTHRCIESVFRYTEAWERLTDRIGFWVDLSSAYVTFHKSYVESEWWALSELFKKGLLYKGHKVVWWWAQGGTALSSGEVGQGYKTVDDPSVFVAFPLESDPKTALLVWTTTPWTLPSNMYAAVQPDFDYAFVTGADDRTLILAKGLVEAVGKKLGKELTVVKEIKGKDLVGTKYVPPFDTYREEGKRHVETHSVIAADFVLMDASGIVHVAPAFGEDDFNAHQKLKQKSPDLPLFCAVLPDGTFSDALPKYKGRWVKDADKDLTHELKERGLLVHQEQYRHEYPFCWRADSDPLIQYARPAWYIKTTAEVSRAIENNRGVHWLPDHIKEGRFGDFLRNNVDWALSRERYWGTPLNIWQCSAHEDHRVAPTSVDDIKARGGSFAKFEEARKKDPKLSEHLIVHKPWIDDVTFPCSEKGCAGTMKRVPDVIDCWFDSGCMPFAQWGYPHLPGSKEIFDKAFPADFISEAIDQTRGWFYSLLMVSTLVFDKAPLPHPYKTCVVLGHVCDKEGKKESKSKGNYTPPEIILERVRMEFAVVRASEVPGLTFDPAQHLAFVAREDYEGLDLTGESALLAAYGEGHEFRGLKATTVKPTKLLPRRVVAMTDEDIRLRQLRPRADALKVLPTEVPRLPSTEKVWLEDTSASAPGADAFRWFFYASSPSWTNTRHSLTNVRLEQKEFLVKLRNVFSFFTIYANIDGFDPARGNESATSVDAGSLAKSKGYRPVKERTELDRWMLSELAIATREVTKALDDYHLYEAARALVELVESTSNWYVRRSRARFWAHGSFAQGTASADKADAYFTLYEVLVTVARLAAPFVPFFAEELYQNLVKGPWPGESPTSQPASVHLVSFPTWDEARVDAKLARDMRAVRDVVSLGQKVRTAHKLKTRAALAVADVIVSDRALRDALSGHTALVSEELNVEAVRLLEPGQEGDVVSYKLQPNFRALGPKLGKKVQVAKAILAKANASKLRTELAETGKVSLDLADGASPSDLVELTEDEIQVAVEAKEGFAAAGGKVGVVVLDCHQTEALKDKTLAREILARVQGIRKELNLDFVARIELGVAGSERVTRVVQGARDLFLSESQASKIFVGAPEVDAAFAADEKRTVTVEGEDLTMAVRACG